MNRKAGFARKIRWLKHVILLSGALNFIMLGLFFYFLIRQNPFSCQFDFAAAPPVQSAKKFTNIETLRALATLPYDELNLKLTDQTDVEEGYEVRDLALAILVRRDHFDLVRALGRRNFSTRLIKVNEKTTLALYPELKEEDFQHVVSFVEKERWPQTSQGLFRELVKQKENADPTLLQAFSITPEFLAAERLFRDSKPQMKKKWLLTLLREGKWETLSSLCKEQQKLLDVSSTKRLNFLLDYLKGGSVTAASLLLLTEYEYCLKKAKDETVCALLQVLPPTSKRGCQFASEILKGARGDLVHATARNKIPKNQ